MLKFNIHNKIKKAIKEILAKDEHLDIDRNDMPQITKENQGKFKKFLSSNDIEYTETEVDSAVLKPTQNEFNLQKIESMIAKELDNNPIFISKDHRILDGHHRFMVYFVNKQKIPVIQINKNIKDLLKLLKSFKHVEYKEIDENFKIF